MYDGTINIKEINGTEGLIVDENGYDYYYEDFNTKELINLYEAFMEKVNEELKIRGQKAHETIEKNLKEKNLQKKENKGKINKEK